MHSLTSVQQHTSSFPSKVHHIPTYCISQIVIFSVPTYIMIFWSGNLMIGSWPVDGISRLGWLEIFLCAWVMEGVWRARKARDRYCLLGPPRNVYILSWRWDKVSLCRLCESASPSISRSNNRWGQFRGIIWKSWMANGIFNVPRSRLRHASPRRQTDEHDFPQRFPVSEWWKAISEANFLTFTSSLSIVYDRESGMNLPSSIPFCGKG